MKSVDLMIFDLDGTLVTSGPDIAASVNDTLATLGLPAIEEAMILEFVGDGVKKLIERSLGPALQVRIEEALIIFSRHYEEHMLDTTTLYPGVIEVLRHFHEKKKVVLTNKRHRFAAAMINALRLTHCFDDILGADSTPYIKPDARLAGLLLTRFGARPDRTVIIGDGVNDILLAKHAGLLSCALLNGLTGRETLLNLKPDYSCEHLPEITSIFC
jgi:phosphoglycolate phosphatase